MDSTNLQFHGKNSHYWAASGGLLLGNQFDSQAEGILASRIEQRVLLGDDSIERESHRSENIPDQGQ